MQNPLRAIYLNGDYYAYVRGTYRRSYGLKNQAISTESGRMFTASGIKKPVHSLTLDLSNDYQIMFGQSVIGTTSWLGVSRLSRLQQIISYQGVSLPLEFVGPEGITRFVVPYGGVDVSQYNTTGLGGVQYRASISLADYS